MVMIDPSREASVLKILSFSFRMNIWPQNLVTIATDPALPCQIKGVQETWVISEKANSDRVSQAASDACHILFKDYTKRGKEIERENIG